MDSFNPEIHIRYSGGMLAKDLNAASFKLQLIFLWTNTWTKTKKTPTPLKIFLFSLGCSVNELFFILTDFFPCEDSQMSLSWVESVVFFN